MQPDSRWLLEKMDQETLQFLEDLKANLLSFDIQSERLPLCREKNHKMQIIAGHLRIRALIELISEGKYIAPQLDGKPCLLEGKHFKLIQVGDEKSRKLWLIENIHRKELSSGEQLDVVEYYLDIAGGNVTAAAAMMKKNRNWVSRRKMVLQSPLRKQVTNGKMTIWVAYAQLKETKEKEDSIALDQTTTPSESINTFATAVKEMADDLGLDDETYDHVAKETIAIESSREEREIDSEHHKGTPAADLFKKPEEHSVVDTRCHFFGLKFYAPEIRCVNCEKELEEECTKKSKANIKVGNIPANHEMSIEKIGREIATLIHNNSDWKEAFVKFATQSWFGGRYDIKQVKLNAYYFGELKKRWKNFQKVSATYSNNLEKMDQINQAYQTWNDSRRDIFKKLQGAVIRVKLPRNFELLNKKVNEITFDDLKFLKPCSKCQIPGTNKNIWRWMVYDVTVCRQHYNDDKKEVTVKNRTGFIKDEMNFAAQTKSNVKEGESLFYRSSTLSPKKFIPLLLTKFPACRAELHQSKPTDINAFNYRIYYKQVNNTKDVALTKSIDAWLTKLNTDERSRTKDLNYAGPTTDVLHSSKQKEAEVGG